ncbi:sigma factor-like helix-turn-helix DNA-binding protein [Streptomyces sp. NPDC101776]|uniref:sigma factor-like helix-turn-helix DNA-binding protein n=1 Tax=Streptomyces sp. NPDC101776 TaxID=3366146 RepID=UPI00380704BD
MIADLGFAAFAERNRPRYTLYARARLATDAHSSAAVEDTLASAREDWQWLMSGPRPAAEVWGQLRLQVERQGERVAAQNPVVAELYRRLPHASADSVVLCRLLALPVSETAELMGVEPSAVEVALTAARRALPRLSDTEAPLRHL